MLFYKEGVCYIDNQTRSLIIAAIKLLSGLPPDDHEYLIWAPNCIECLQFALDNEKLLVEKPELYHDTLSTLNLLYLWIIEEKGWAYIELREKFKTRYSVEKNGKALKTIIDKINKENTNSVNENFSALSNIIDVQNQDGSYKSMYQILEELAEIL
jgi:hypothetical protein